MPASASPAVTLVTTPRTFCSRLTGVTVTPAAVEDLVGVVAAGDLGGADDDLDVGVGQVGDAGDALRVAGANDDRQQVGGEDTGSLPLSPASVSLSMLAVSAEANTSAGAPSMICCTSAEEASKLNVAVASGLAALNASPTSVKAR